MMKSSIKLLFILPLLCILTAAACKKDDLPKATQTGENTMAAKLNGKAWVKKACASCIGGGTALRVNYEDRSFFGISGEDRDQNITITLVVPVLKKVGTYNLSSRETNFARLYNNNNNINYFSSNNNMGKITITKINLAEQIISGTFEFTAEDENNPANTVEVTDGRFDIKYL